MIPLEEIHLQIIKAVSFKGATSCTANSLNILATVKVQSPDGLGPPRGKVGTGCTAEFWAILEQLQYLALLCFKGGIFGHNIGVMGSCVISQ